MRYVVLGLLTVTFCRAAGELPVLGQRPALSYQPGPRLTAPLARPVAEVLAAMSWAEKANARVSFLVDTPEAREAEAFWNSGDWDRALALIRMLEPELAEILSRLINNFNYEAILTAIEQTTSMD